MAQHNQKNLPMHASVVNPIVIKQQYYYSNRCQIQSNLNYNIYQSLLDKSVPYVPLQVHNFHMHIPYPTDTLGEVYHGIGLKQDEWVKIDPRVLTQQIASLSALSIQSLSVNGVIYLVPSRLAHIQVTKLALYYTTVFCPVAGKPSQPYHSIKTSHKR